MSRIIGCALAIGAVLLLASTPSADGLDDETLFLLGKLDLNYVWLQELRRFIEAHRSSGSSAGASLAK